MIDRSETENLRATREGGDCTASQFFPAENPSFLIGHSCRTESLVYNSEASGNQAKVEAFSP